MGKPINTDSRRSHRSATTATTAKDAAAPPVSLRPAALFTRFALWVTSAPHALYSLSALRILYGFSILAFLATNFADRHYLWGVASGWVEPEAKRRGYMIVFRGIFSKDDAFAFDVAYLTLVVLAVVFLIGWQTRFITPILLIFWVGLATNSTVLTNGGDTIMRLSLLFLVFANLSQHWSVDARRRKTRNNSLTRRNSVIGIPNWLRNTAHNTALMLCGYQILLVYVNSGIYKLMGKEWLDGTAFYYSLTLDVFRPFPLLSDLAWQLTIVVYIATWLSVWVQLLFPLLVLWRPTRIVALVFLMGMHFGIGLFLGLWPFSIAMIALDLLFVRDSSWRAAYIWLRPNLANVRDLLLKRDQARAQSAPIEDAVPETAQTQNT